MFNFEIILCEVDLVGVRMLKSCVGAFGFLRKLRKRSPTSLKISLIYFLLEPKNLQQISKYTRRLLACQRLTLVTQITLQYTVQRQMHLTGGLVVRRLGGPWRQSILAIFSFLEFWVVGGRSWLLDMMRTSFTVYKSTPQYQSTRETKIGGAAPPFNYSWRLRTV